MVKRGLAASYEEWLLAAEYVMAGGTAATSAATAATTATSAAPTAALAPFVLRDLALVLEHGRFEGELEAVVFDHELQGGAVVIDGQVAQIQVGAVDGATQLLRKEACHELVVEQRGLARN